MMQSLTIVMENFRSIEKASIELHPGINLLIGSNGSGKTNILAGLKFLRELFRQGAGLALAKSGGPVRNYRRGENIIRFSLLFDYGERLYLKKRVPFRIHWTVAIAQTGPEGLASVLGERLKVIPAEHEPVFEATMLRQKDRRPRGIVSIANPEMVGRDLFSIFSTLSKDPKHTMFNWLKNDASAKLDRVKLVSDQIFLPQLAIFDRKLREAVNRLIDLNEYNFLPDVARQAADQLPFAELSPNGGGLAEVIHAIHNRSYQRLFARRNTEPQFPSTWLIGPNGRWHSVAVSDAHSERLNWLDRHKALAFESMMDQINDQISAVRPLTEVSTQVDPTNGRRFVIFRASENTFYPDEVSDGTIKWLAIIVSILVPFSRTYLLEEPENFLHPWMQQQLVRLMREQSVLSQSTFVITSHSATVLNASLPEEITVVTRTDSGTKASRLERIKDVRDLLESSDFGIGDLWVSGMLGGVPEGGL